MEMETCDLKNNVIQTLELARRRVKILFLVYNVMMQTVLMGRDVGLPEI